MIQRQHPFPSGNRIFVNHPLPELLTEGGSIFGYRFALLGVNFRLSKLKAEEFKKSDPVMLPDFTPLEIEIGLEIIKLAYRTLAKKYHPDHGGAEESMKALINIKDAFACTIDRHTALENLV
ncbi:MAG: hypothetical protein KFF50_14230 [Desulfatitalea sp.]|nr:hypothetical protein [Desulfatitalea sp.]